MRSKLDTQVINTLREEKLDLKYLTLEQARAIIPITNRAYFKVVEPYGFMELYHTCFIMYLEKASYLVNLNKNMHLVIDLTTLNQFKSVRLSLIENDFKIQGSKDYTILQNYKSSANRPPYHNQQLRLDQYSTESYLIKSFKKLKDPKYTKQHVMSFIYKLIDKRYAKTEQTKQLMRNDQKQNSNGHTNNIERKRRRKRST